MSITHTFNLQKNTDLKKFEVLPIFPSHIETQAELCLLYTSIHGSSPIYMTDEYMVNFIEASFLVSYREQEGKIPELTQEWE